MLKLKIILVLLRFKKKNKAIKYYKYYFTKRNYKEKLS